MRRFDDEDLAGAEFRECDPSEARLIGVVMQDAEIDGLVNNLVVNGVEVMPYVEAELDRRHPVWLLIRSDEPADLREAWRQLRDDWSATAERVRSMLAVRDRQASEIEAWLAEVSREQLEQIAPVPDDDRWPPYAKGRRVRDCLGTVLGEEWAHHGFCVRDLDKLAGQEAPRTQR